MSVIQLEHSTTFVYVYTLPDYLQQIVINTNSDSHLIPGCFTVLWCVTQTPNHNHLLPLVSHNTLQYLWFNSQRHLVTHNTWHDNIFLSLMKIAKFSPLSHTVWYTCTYINIYLCFSLIVLKNITKNSQNVKHISSTLLWCGPWSGRRMGRQHTWMCARRALRVVYLTLMVIIVI